MSKPIDLSSIRYPNLPEELRSIKRDNGEIIEDIIWRWMPRKKEYDPDDPHRHDPLALEYAIQKKDRASSGMILWARWKNDEWEANTWHDRPVIMELLRQCKESHNLLQQPIDPSSIPTGELVAELAIRGGYTNLVSLDKEKGYSVLIRELLIQIKSIKENCGPDYILIIIDPKEVNDVTKTEVQPDQ